MRKKARKTHRKLMQMIALTVSVMMVFVSADGTKLFADSMQKFNDTLKDETNELKVSAQASLKTVSKGSAFKAERVEKDTALYKGIESKADDLAKGSSHRSLLAYSFTFSKNGKSYQPYGNIDVAMNWRNAISPSSYKDAQDITVYNFSLKNNKVTDVEKLSDQPYTKTEVNNEHKLKSLSFKSDQLSYVVITWTNKPVTYDHSLSYKGKDYNISLKYGDSTKINSTDRLEVKELGKDHKDYDHYSDAAAKKVINNKADADDLDVARLFDIKIIDTTGKEKEPDASVQVNFTFNKKQSNLSDYQIVHFKNNSVKNIQVLDPQSHKDNKSLSFKTDSFSLYEIINVDLTNDALKNVGKDVLINNLQNITYGDSASYEIVNISDYLKNPDNKKGWTLQCPQIDAKTNDGKFDNAPGTAVDLSTNNEVAQEVTRWHFEEGTNKIYTKVDGINYFLNISGDHKVTVGKIQGTPLNIKAGKKVGDVQSLIFYKNSTNGYINPTFDENGNMTGATYKAKEQNDLKNSSDDELSTAGFVFRKIEDNKEGDIVKVNVPNNATGNDQGRDVTNSFMNSIDTNKSYALVNVATVLANNKRTQGLSLQRSEDGSVGKEKEVMTVLPDETNGFVYKSNLNNSNDGNPFFNNMKNQNSVKDNVTKWFFKKRDNSNQINIFTTDDGTSTGTKHYLDVNTDNSIVTVDTAPQDGFTIRKGKSESQLNSFVIYKEEQNKRIKVDFSNGNNTGKVNSIEGGDGLPSDDDQWRNAGFILCKVAEQQPGDAHIGVKKSISEITKDMESAGDSLANGLKTDKGTEKKVIVYTRDNLGNYYALAYGGNNNWRYLKKLYNNGTSIGYRGNEDAVWTLKKEDYDYTGDGKLDDDVYNLYDQGQTSEPNSPKVYKSFDGEQDEKHTRGNGVDGFYPLILQGAKKGTYGTTIMRADYVTYNLTKNSEKIAKRYPQTTGQELQAEISWAEQNPYLAGSLENIFISRNGEKQKAIDSNKDDIDSTVADKTDASFTTGSNSESIAYNWYFAEIESDDGNDGTNINNGGKIKELKTVDSISKGIKINMFDYDGNSDSKGWYWEKDGNSTNSTTEQGKLLGHYFKDSKTDGQDIVKGIVDNKLNQNKYPNISQGNNFWGSDKANLGASLEPLFSNNNKINTYENCNNLFSQDIYDETGYFEYSSFNNFAHLDTSPENGQYKFVLYNQIASPYAYYKGQDHDNDIDKLDESYLDSSVLNSKYLERGNFLPFNDIAHDKDGNVLTNDKRNITENNGYGRILPRTVKQTEDTLNEVEYAPNAQLIDQNMQNMNKNDSNFGRAMYRVLHPDYRFGMTMEADFYQPAGTDGKAGKDANQDNRPITFEFNGDDDMWVFIDDVLVLDIGGVHDAHHGKIDFATGDVTIDTYADKDHGGINTPVVWKDNIKNIFKQADTDVSGANFIDTANDLSDGKDVHGTFAKNTTHTLKMFYMERGEGASNLMLRTNIQTSKLGVTKKVVDHDGNDMTTSNLPDVIKNRINHTEFYFRIKESTNSDSSADYLDVNSLYNDQDQANEPYYQDKDGHTVQISGHNVPLQTAEGSNGKIFILYNGYTAYFPGIDANKNHIQVEEVPFYNQNRTNSENNLFDYNSDQISKANNSPVTELYKMFDQTKGVLERDGKVVYSTAPETLDHWVNLDKNTTTGSLSVSDTDRNEGDRFEFTNKLREATVNIKKLAGKKNDSDGDLPVAGAEYTLYPVNSSPSAYIQNSSNEITLKRFASTETDSVIPDYPSSGNAEQSVYMNQFKISDDSIYYNTDDSTNSPLYTLGEIKSYNKLSGENDYDKYIASKATRDSQNKWKPMFDENDGVKYKTSDHNDDKKGYFYSENANGSIDYGSLGMKLIPGVTYILKETKGAPGYNTSKDVWALLVDYDKNDQLQTHIKCLTDGDGNELPKDAVDSHFTVTDTPGTSLPVTGQRGIVLSLLIAGAFIAYSSYRIVKKRRDDDAEE